MAEEHTSACTGSGFFSDRLTVMAQGSNDRSDRDLQDRPAARRARQQYAALVQAAEEFNQAVGDGLSMRIGTNVVEALEADYRGRQEANLNTLFSVNAGGDPSFFAARGFPIWLEVTPQNVDVYIEAVRAAAQAAQQMRETGPVPTSELPFETQIELIARHTLTDRVAGIRR